MATANGRPEANQEALDRWQSVTVSLMILTIKAGVDDDGPDDFDPLAVAPAFGEMLLAWAMEHPEQARAWYEAIGADDAPATTEWLSEVLAIEDGEPAEVAVIDEDGERRALFPR